MLQLLQSLKLELIIKSMAWELELIIKSMTWGKIAEETLERLGKIAVDTAGKMWAWRTACRTKRDTLLLLLEATIRAPLQCFKKLKSVAPN